MSKKNKAKKAKASGEKKDPLEQMLETYQKQFKDACTALAPLIKERDALESKMGPMRDDLYDLNQEIKELMPAKGEAEARIRQISIALGKDPASTEKTLKAETGKVGSKT